MQFEVFGVRAALFLHLMSVSALFGPQHHPRCEWLIDPFDTLSLESTSCVSPSTLFSSSLSGSPDFRNAPNPQFQKELPFSFYFFKRQSTAPSTDSASPLSLPLSTPSWSLARPLRICPLFTHVLDLVTPRRIWNAIVGLSDFWHVGTFL